MLRRSLALLLIIILGQGFALAHTITFSQGELVTLKLKIINRSEQDIQGLRACFDNKPEWLMLSCDPASIDVPGRSQIVLPIVFTVNKNVKCKNSNPVILRLTDDKGNTWKREISFRILPDRFMSWQNYPNPFNPETWIPYQVKEDCVVTIKIFDSTGRLVRTLDLGQRPAGFYISKSEAAYWDGKNEAGENISSGVYFYHLQAGRFSEIKKMLAIR